MKLHILTACTRAQNLCQLAASMEGAEGAGVDLTWHIRFDRARQAVGGQALKNAMLEQITDGWVAILDDDNLLHDAFFTTVAAAVLAHESAQLLVIAQQHAGGWVRQAERRMLRQTHVDAGQVVIRREAIGHRRIPLHYCGDGEWIEGIADSLDSDQIVCIREVATYYNWLRGET